MASKTVSEQGEIEVVGTAVFLDTGFLYLRRASTDSLVPNVLGVPGGHKEETDVSVRAAARRETHEEAGIELAESEFIELGTFRNSLKDSTGNVIAKLFAHGFLVVEPQLSLADVKMNPREHSEKLTFDMDTMWLLYNKFVGLRQDGAGKITMDESGFFPLDVDLIRNGFPLMAEIVNKKLTELSLSNEGKIKVLA